MDIKNIKEYLQSQSFRGVLIGIGIAVAVLLIFQAGVITGYHKASFAHHFGDTFYRAEGGRQGMFFASFKDGPFAAHGAAGQIVSIELPTFVVASPDNIEKVVHIQDDTLIRNLDEEASSTDLQVGNFVVVLGEPNNNSQIEAKLIRIMPFPPDPGGVQIIKRP